VTESPLSARVRDGDPRALARAMSLVEDESAAGASLMRDLFAHTGRAYVIGVTGTPGAGKSTLVDRLIGEVRASGRTVGVIAVDPTSPFTGGAILGDRVRMQAHAGDPGVFIRSMATRGHLGGIARATGDIALILDAAGKDVVIIETVGVGQDEVDIVRTADVSIVTIVPGSGDEVQALKAGIMEIADIFVVNKADMEGADRAVAAIRSLQALQRFAPGEWRPPILKTEATTGRGVPELAAAIERFREHAAGATAGRRRERAAWRVRELAARRFLQRVETGMGPTMLEQMLDRIAAREVDPYTAADEMIARAIGASAPGAPPATAGPAFRSGGGEVEPAAYPVGPTFTSGGIEGSATLDHVGIAVADIEQALAFYRDALGLEIGEAENVPSQHVRAHFVAAGGAALELLEATSPESPIAKYVARRGPGLHHITLHVEDVASVLARLDARGMRLIDRQPRPGAHGSLVAFVHPSSAHGVLVELKQAAPGPEER
jgi:LAO/AO transport system kinase